MSFLDKKLVLHWLFLVEAIYILVKAKITIPELDKADELMHRFVADTQNLHSTTVMTFNVHLLLYLTRSVFNWGPLLLTQLTVLKMVIADC